MVRETRGGDGDGNVKGKNNGICVACKPIILSSFINIHQNKLLFIIILVRCLQ